MKALPSQLLCVLMGMTAFAWGADSEFTLTIRDHRFEPTEVRVPAGKKIKIVIVNQDSTPEEFDSHELKREKVIPAKSKVAIYVGPLASGRYPFVGEFNAQTANGVVVAQ